MFVIQAVRHGASKLEYLVLHGYIFQIITHFFLRYQQLGMLNFTRWSRGGGGKVSFHAYLYNFLKFFFVLPIITGRQVV